MGQEIKDTITKKYKKVLAKILNTDVNNISFIVEPTVYGIRYEYSVVDKNINVSRFTMSCFPHQCGMQISSGASVSTDLRNKGIGGLLNRYRIEMAKYGGYSRLICSNIIHPNMTYQKKIFDKNGWTEIYDFKNKRTNNNISIYVVDLLSHTFLNENKLFDMYNKNK